MKTEKIISLLCIGSVVGFCIGLAGGLEQVMAQRYLHHGMYRLSFLLLKDQLNRWLLLSLATLACFLLACGVFFLIFSLFKRIVAGIRSNVFGCPGPGRRVTNFLAALSSLLCLILAACSAGAVTGGVSLDLVRAGGGILLAILLLWGGIRLKEETLSRLIRIKALFILIGLLTLNMGIIADTTLATPSGPNIILVLVDCLRPDHLSCYGYARETSPNIDALAKNGIAYGNAYSNAPWTKPAIATLFTSFYPNVHSVVTPSHPLPAGMLTISEILKNGGYETCFINGGNAFIGEEFNYDQGFDYYRYLPHRRKNAADVTDHFLSWIAGRKERRYFAYLHYMDAHAPYTRNGYNTFFQEVGDNQFIFNQQVNQCSFIRMLTSIGELSDGQKEQIIALYDGQIKFVDENLGRILGFLREQGTLENTVIIVTADHGEEFWDHGNFEHGHTLYNELLHVPLIISGGGINPSLESREVSLVDLMPTVLSLAGISPERVAHQGACILQSSRNGREGTTQPVFATGTLYGNEKYCLIRGAMKMIVTTSDHTKKWDLIGYRNESRRELYNLQRDSREQNNLLPEVGAAIPSLNYELTAFMTLAPALREGEMESVVVDGRLKEQLHALGYVQ